MGLAVFIVLVKMYSLVLVHLAARLAKERTRMNDRWMKKWKRDHFAKNQKIYLIEKKAHL